MSDLVLSVFQLSNARFCAVPKMDFEYVEKDTGTSWHITAGGTRAYLLRHGEGLVKLDSEAIGEQNADSHFMMSRALSALLLGGQGLFQSSAVGRVFFTALPDQPRWAPLYRTGGSVCNEHVTVW